MASNKFSWDAEVNFKQEDQALIALVNEKGEKKWCTIATLINERFPGSDKTGKQCRERWHNHLNPCLNKESFTIEDEIKVFELQRQYGNKWSLIAEHFDGRNDNFIKNCFYSAIRRNLRKYNRKKVPSKQLKGTINSLLRNPQTKKILMSFPEHENPEIKSAEVEEKKVDEKKVEIKKVSNKKEGKSPNLRVNVPDKNQPAFKPVKISSFNRRDIGDITPTLFANFSLGIIPEDYENVQEMFGVNTPIGINPPDSGRNEPLSAYQLILPDYCLQNSFQHYISPRNSK